MAERGKDERTEQTSKLDALIKKHEELIPTVLKTQVKVDLYWKCYACVIARGEMAGDKGN